MFAGTIVFLPEETEKYVEINIVDDEYFEEDKQFYIKLHNLRIKNAKGFFECVPDLLVSNLSQQCDLLKRLDRQLNGLLPSLRVITLPIAQEPCKILRACVQLRQNAATATVRILDDDHGGIFQFDNANLEVPETVGEAQFVVVRTQGMLFLSYL